ncbi:hypothetical protein [Bradyrhizobium sp. BRP56]|uniref:hypothetical protein n=1 Tax=Bradyrhizobium sp. BRP56 TaxID=2793819 RepID=UPI001CD786C1|nr:hypothetical protein [Bradyrhizobium sp. BRP56]MCA1396015.1 hypothetical protein [Bradyrhizobium sp. BRP56]
MASKRAIEATVSSWILSTNAQLEQIQNNGIKIRSIIQRFQWAFGKTSRIRRWVAYRCWQNKFGLDHNAAPGVCTIAATGQSTNTCTESTVYGGVMVKF